MRSREWGYPPRQRADATGVDPAQPAKRMMAVVPAPGELRNSDIQPRAFAQPFHHVQAEAFAGERGSAAAVGWLERARQRRRVHARTGVLDLDAVGLDLHLDPALVRVLGGIAQQLPQHHPGTRSGACTRGCACSTTSSATGLPSSSVAPTPPARARPRCMSISSLSSGTSDCRARRGRRRSVRSISRIAPPDAAQRTAPRSLKPCSCPSRSLSRVPRSAGCVNSLASWVKSRLRSRNRALRPATVPQRCATARLRRPASSSSPRSKACTVGMAGSQRTSVRQPRHRRHRDLCCGGSRNREIHHDTGDGEQQRPAWCCTARCGAGWCAALRRDHQAPAVAFADAPSAGHPRCDEPRPYPAGPPRRCLPVVPAGRIQLAMPGIARDMCVHIGPIFHSCAASVCAAGPPYAIAQVGPAVDQPRARAPAGNERLGHEHHRKLAVQAFDASGHRRDRSAYAGGV